MKSRIKKECNKALNSWWQEKANEAEEKHKLNIKLGRGGSLIDSLRLIGRLVHNQHHYILDKDGIRKIKNTENKLNRWCEHFSNITNIKTKVSQESYNSLKSISWEPNYEGLMNQLSEDEIQTAIKQFKKSSAPSVLVCVFEFFCMFVFNFSAT